MALLAGVLPLGAQIPGLPSKLPAVQAVTPTESPDVMQDRLQQWLKEARVAFARSSEPAAESQLPAGVDGAALADYRRDLEQVILAINRLQKILTAAPEARKALDVARASDAAWTGFSEKPPYSVLMVDELINQQDAIKEKSASYRSSLELFGRTLAGIQEEARLAEDSSRRVQSAAAEDPSADGAAKWRLAADRTKSRLLAVRATFLQSNVALLQDQAEAAKIQLSLLDRQITRAKRQLTFSEDDLARVQKAATDRQSALRKDTTAIRKRQQDATAARVRLQTALDLLLKATPDGSVAEQTPELALATIKLEAAEARVESLQFVVENLESLDQLESYGSDIYQSRKTLMESKSTAIRGPALQSLRSNFDRIKAWEIVVANELASVNADISKQESRATSIAADDPRLIPINDLRAALWEKQAVIQRVSQAVATQRRIVSRWLGDFDESHVERPVTEILTIAAVSTWDWIKRIWTFEVFQYDDTLMTLAGPVQIPKAVKLGQFFIAILFFGASYFIVSRIKNRLRNAVVRRGHIADAQAKTLSNWLMIVVGFLLAVATLHFLKIPLTLFAFLGGALVIGLGFGTQTLIKNFISGIIVLFERKIRVGDVVDVGGITGSIIEINTRSSVLRGGDGRETLVPNSLFLENRVTNLTLSNRRVRRMLTVRVALGSSPQEVSTILKECVERHGLILKEPAPIVTFEDFADNAHVFGIYYWTEFNDKTNSDVVASDLRFMIEKRFSESGIEFPSAKQEAPIPRATVMTMNPSDE